MNKENLEGKNLEEKNLKEHLTYKNSVAIISGKIKDIFQSYGKRIHYLYAYKLDNLSSITAFLQTRSEKLDLTNQKNIAVFFQEYETYQNLITNNHFRFHDQIILNHTKKIEVKYIKTKTRYSSFNNRKKQFFSTLLQDEDVYKSFDNFLSEKNPAIPREEMISYLQSMRGEKSNVDLNTMPKYTGDLHRSILQYTQPKFKKLSKSKETYEVRFGLRKKLHKDIAKEFQEKRRKTAIAFAKKCQDWQKENKTSYEDQRAKIYGNGFDSIFNEQLCALVKDHFSPCLKQITKEHTNSVGRKTSLTESNYLFNKEIELPDGLETLKKWLKAFFLKLDPDIKDIDAVFSGITFTQNVGAHTFDFNRAPGVHLYAPAPIGNAYFSTLKTLFHESTHKRDLGNRYDTRPLSIMQAPEVGYRNLLVLETIANVGEWVGLGVMRDILGEETYQEKLKLYYYDCLLRICDTTRHLDLQRKFINEEDLTVKKGKQYCIETLKNYGKTDDLFDFPEHAKLNAPIQQSYYFELPFYQPNHIYGRLLGLLIVELHGHNYELIAEKLRKAYTGTYTEQAVFKLFLLPSTYKEQMELIIELLPKIMERFKNTAI